MGSFWKTFFRYLRHMVLPERCPFCGEVMEFGRHCCKRCESQITYFPGDICALCFQRSCICGHKVPGFHHAFAAFVYDGLAKQSVHMMKFRQGKGNGEHLAWYLAQVIQRHPEFSKIQGICFMPMSAKKRRKRGYNQAEVLAKHLSQYLHIPVYPALKTLRETQTQHELSAAERKQNLRGAYGFHSDCPPLPETVLLVDDVITTGTSMYEGGRVLLSAGAKRVIPAAVCRVKKGIEQADNNFLPNPSVFHEK
ncbi:MAG: ComF family protein [Massiliimalia sp.]|jgi:ComF family protein